METDKSTKGIVLVVLVFFAGFMLGQWSGKRNADTVIPFTSEVEDIVKTVAHVSVTNEDLELIYSNAEQDIAYYRYIGERSLLNIGDSVQLYDGTAGSITSTSINGFTVSFDIPVVQGLSGMAILTEEGEQVGYVSQLLDNGDVYCIWS